MSGYTKVGYVYDEMWSGVADDVSFDISARLRETSSPHALACVGITFQEILNLCTEKLMRENPGLWHKRVVTKMHIRSNGIRLEFFEEEGFRKCEADIIAKRTGIRIVA